MGRKKTGKKVMSIRVYEENESALKLLVAEKDKELKYTSLSKPNPNESVADNKAIKKLQDESLTKVSEQQLKK